MHSIYCLRDVLCEPRIIRIININIKCANKEPFVRKMIASVVITVVAVGLILMSHTHSRILRDVIEYDSFMGLL